MLLSKPLELWLQQQIAQGQSRARYLCRITGSALYTRHDWRYLKISRSILWHGSIKTKESDDCKFLLTQTLRIYLTVLLSCEPVDTGTMNIDALLRTVTCIELLIIMVEAKVSPDVGAAILALAGETGPAPFYVYDLRTVRARAAQLTSAFPGAILLYAMKANSNPHVVRTIIEAGFGIETVSYGEVMLAWALGAKRILFTNNNISDEEMGAVLALAGKCKDACDIWINCDSISRLERMPAGQGVFVRANGPVGAGHHAKVTTCESWK